ncbi:MAG: hypothetical protein ACK50G_03660 [bacterium]|jgi:hypothetical protein
MPVTADLFERWKASKNFTSDRQACLALGVSNGNPGHWRDGKNAHAAVIERMARDLGHTDREIAALLFESMAEAAQADADSRKTFERLAKKVRTLALTAVAVLASSSFPAPSHARAHGYEEAGAVFIMRTVLAWLKALQQRMHIGFGIPATPTTGVSLNGTSTMLRIARTH